MNLAKFLTDTLISGYGNGSFTAEQVVIFAMNYLNRSQITQEHFDQLMAVLYPEDEEEQTEAGEEILNDYMAEPTAKD